jgi:hypothetical protein
MRCPVGAISLKSSSVAEVSPPNLLNAELAFDEQDFLNSRMEDKSPSTWTEETWKEISTRLAENCSRLRQEHFYPLVARLFTAAGLLAWLPPRGDTNNRIDLILLDDRNSIPVEIKSKTESEAINVKSIQQALENRVILDERKFFPAVRDSSTLVVGFSYPPSRSDVSELVEDIAMAFGVNIGLISLSDLFRLALQKQLAGIELSRSRLENLKGPLS